MQRTGEWLLPETHRQEAIHRRRLHCRRRERRRCFSVSDSLSSQSLSPVS
ncbi:hypothetical protein HanXRQr2_Chr16g0740721 [Helianthus annuus]|uniref:Uncharacterized protein n=1 Tax=Helianthus annuus TaxID=4232 RepID=A0A9K3DRK3_HELAN|nr:hypothetical protein HanXRQr2_Chr16g0740721 [Helianthus annuus]